MDLELKREGSYQVHSTTGKIPDIRFYRALDEKRSLFRKFRVPYPFESTKDVFALRDDRVVNAYRKISINNLQTGCIKGSYKDRVYLRIVPDQKTELAEVRFWYNKKLVGVQKLRNEDLKMKI
ncbi:MAG: hypothetical protein R6U35_03910 [Candidatus Humimicrobiaceae bacterium]